MDPVGAAVQRWRTAEDRLYPSLMTMEPDRYGSYLTTVRAIADELSRWRTPDDLVEAYGQRSALTAMAAGRLGPLADAGLVVDAAFNLRYREVAEQSRRAEVRGRIAEAGPGWLLVRSSPVPHGFAGYERLELHIPSRAGLHAWIEEDIDSARPRYAVQVLPLDPASGEVLPDRPALCDPLTFDEPEGWEHACAELRQRFTVDTKEVLPWPDPSASPGG